LECSLVVLEFAAIHDTVSAMPQFRLRSLLMLFALVGVALFLLANPWPLWLVLLPPLLCIASGLAMARANISRRKRIYWSSFLISMIAYGFGAIGIDLVFMSIGIWPYSLMGNSARVVWLVFNDGVQVPPTFEYVTFVIYFHLFVAVLISAMTAFVAQSLIGEKD